MKILLVVVEEDFHNESSRILGVLQFTGKLNYKKVLLTAYEYLKNDWPSRFDRCKVELFGESEKGKFDNLLGECYILDILQSWQSVSANGVKLDFGSYFVLSNSFDYNSDVLEYIKL